MKLIKGCLLVFALFATTLCFAVSSNISFSPQEANKTLDQLTLDLSTKELKVQNFEKAISVLTTLQENAKQCVDASQRNITDIDKLWQDVKPENDQAPLTSVQTYLKAKKDELKARKSECKLFVLRSQEAIDAFSTTVQKLTTKALLKVKPTFLTKIISSTQLTKKLKESFDIKLFLENSGWKTFGTPLTLSITGFLLFLFILIGIKLKNLAKTYIATKKIETAVDQFKITFIDAISKNLIVIFIALILSAITSIQGIFTNHLTYLMLISVTLLGYSVSLTLFRFFFLPIHELTPMCGLSKKISSALLMRLSWLAHITLVGTIIYFLFYQQALPQQVIDLARTISITLFALFLISILWIIVRIPKLFIEHKILRFIICFTLTIGLLGILVAEWLGYQQLVTYLLISITLSLLSFFIAWMVHKITFSTLSGFRNSHSEMLEKLRSHLGIERHETIPEMILLYIVSFTLIWGGFAITLLNLWGLSEAHFKMLTIALSEGFKIAGIMIIPENILIGFLFFIFMSLLIRWLRKFIETNTKLGTEKGSREALAAMIGYVGIAIIVLISLLIAGVNFAGLAIIAGALSVGIGFGLQNIVNNFVSGLVLLIERPIKPGDRIQIGNTEGFVKKISIRATQIKTLQKSDLIVPNAEIISGQVTNYMFKDFYGRIDLSVGVAYGTDTELVKKVLLEVANEHPEVISDDSTNQPVVLFSSFNDSALQFALYCIIRNVNLKYIVASELHFAVDKAFKQNNITIAFPQRDLHIHDWVNVHQN